MPIGGSPSRACGRPARGAAESELSGTALVRRAHWLTGHFFAHAGEVFSAADTDVVLRPLVEDFTQGMAILRSILACMLNPGCFVVGGGCMRSRAFFWDALLSRYRDFTPPAYRDTPLLCAVLAEPGLIGAALAQRMRP